MGRSKIKDPYADREAQKYSDPIVSREYILEYLRGAGHPLTYEELIHALKLKSADHKEALRRRLRAMERDGQLIRNRKKGYGLVEKMNLIAGRVISHREGFGFVVPDDGSGDLFLSARQMRVVLHGDRVLVNVIGIDRKNRREGAIVEVLERAITRIVGRLLNDNGILLVASTNKRIHHDILIPPGEQHNARVGQMVVAEIISPPTQHNRAIGRVIEVLGEHLAPGMEIDIALRNYNIPHIWSDDVLNEIAKISPEVQVSEKDLAERKDLRELAFVTIDGEDAKDFDDAVFCQRKQKNWQLYVAIADVSHYVNLHTALDQEALNRGNSVYFPGSVVPMLPEILSNELCSLKPKVDRFCMVCEATINSTGELIDAEFYPAIIHSQARLTYTQVAAWLENSAAMPDDYRPLLKHLQNLHGLFETLFRAREIRGAIDFETVETRIIFGSDRKIEKIVPTQRNVAHRIIEECMLVANVATAKLLEKNQLCAPYRIHAGPSAEKLLDLREFLNGLGLQLHGGNKPQSSDYASLLKQISTRPDAHLIQTVLLRSLSQAIYSPENIGHFGLAYPAYTHFTSPIRRYPDLLVHRAIRYQLSAGKAKQFAYEPVRMLALSEHCSMTERRADDATREALDWLKCEFMRDRVGEEFIGVITNVMAFGFFVELKEVYIEGLVHVTALKNDYYHFDVRRHALTGERSGKVYRLGDPIKVRVVRVDIENREIDFELADANLQQAATKKNSKKSSKKKSKNIAITKPVKKDKSKKRK